MRRGDDRRFSLDIASLLRDISTPPPLPAGWRCEVAVSLAFDAAIGGDFTVFCVDEAAGRMRAMVVDTSGKGAAAASRAVLLAGAVAVLLAELPISDVLPAANRHVARLGSDEDFATAVLVDLHFRTGELLVGVAGHPPPVRFDSGTGRWLRYDVTGPALGFLPDASWELHKDTLRRNDALIVVTDGVVELPGADVDWGLDRMLGHAERLVLTGWHGGAETLLTQRRRGDSDDAQVLLLTRG